MDLRLETISALLSETAEGHGGRVGVEAAGARYTWREVRALTAGAAEALARRGVVRGGHVALWGGNSLDWILTFLAVMELGAVAVLLNNHYTGRELREVLRLSGAAWLCCGDCPARDARPDLPARALASCGLGVERAVEMRTDPALRRQWLAEPRTPRKPDGAVSCRDVCCLLFTSGSTAKPKCVGMTHHALVNNALGMAEALGLRPTDKICLSTPLFHIFCLCGSFLAGMCAGAALAVPDSLRSAALLACVEGRGCSVLNGVPTSYLALTRSPEFSPRRMASVRLGVMGGAPILERQMAELLDTLPHTELMINYGQTEGGCICNTGHGDGLERLAHTVGWPLPHIAVAAADPETGRRLDPGRAGELVVRGYNVMAGLYPPGGDRGAVDGGGWLHTGDLGRVNPDGSVTLVGRKRDIIIRGGEDITPREVENVILGYEPVLDVKVFGMPHEVLGEQVVACVVPRPGADVCEEALRAWMERNLAPFKIPAAIFWMECLPLGASGKPDLLRLRSQVAAGRQRSMSVSGGRTRERPSGPAGEKR